MWTLALIGLMALSLMGGCTGPSQQVLPAKVLFQSQEANANQDLQNQLMAQASQGSLTNYKDYKVGAEDQLAITIYGQDSLNRKLRVNGQGEITMPLVGVVKVAGLTTEEIEKRLADLYNASFLVNPQVTVEVKEFRHQRVAVTGAVKNPGSYEIIGPRTLLEVLSMAGGFAGPAAGDVINVTRHQNAPDLAQTVKPGIDQPYASKTETIVINLHRLISGQSPDLNILVNNGDVVDVPFAGTAYVLGGVRRPGNIAVRENLTLSQAIALAGGIDPILGTDNITLMRFDEQGKPLNIDTNLNSIIARQEADIPVKKSDVIVVNESGLKKTLFVIRALFPLPTPTLPTY